MNEDFPMMNEKAEEECPVVKEAIIRNAKEMKFEVEGYQTRYTGCMVENMKPHILSDLCLVQKEKSIPDTKPCHHSAERR